MDSYLPLFIYGSLIDDAVRGALAGSTVVRRVPGAAMGRWETESGGFPSVIFSQPEEEIRGEVVWLQRDHFDSAVVQLDAYEGAPSLYRRVRVPVRIDGAHVEAYAYEWVVREAWGKFLDAAQLKIEIAQYHQDVLEKEVPALGPHAKGVAISAQASFEGVLYAFIAASDQLAEAINLGFKLNVQQTTLQEALEKMPREYKLRRKLFKWQQARIAADVRDIRRLATHRHYVKLRLEVQRPTGAPPYGGPRGLVEYSAAAVQHARRLLPLVDELERLLSHAGQ